MNETEDFPKIRCRLRDLNTKAYYLLVALSFLYYRAGTTPTQGPAPLPLKLALTFTGAVAVLPVQDYIRSKCILEGIRFAKVLLLWAVFICTVTWIWRFS